MLRLIISASIPDAESVFKYSKTSVDEAFEERRDLILDCSEA